MNEEFYENEIRKDFDKLDSLNSQADISGEGDLHSIVENMGEAISKAEKTIKDYNIYNNLNNNGAQNKTKDIQKKLADNKKRWKKLKEKLKLIKKNSNKNDDNNNALNEEGDDDATNSIKYNSFNKLQLATRSTIEMENMSGNILGDLSNQSHQMKGVSSKIGLINDDMDISNSVLGKMFNRQGRDKKIIVIFGIILILIFLGTLTYKIINKFK